MRHQSQVIRVVMSDLFQTVGKFLTSRKQLFEIGKARRHWVSTSVNNGRIRQNGLDQTNVHPVIGHLVDKVRLIGSVFRRTVEVSLPVRHSFFSRQIDEI